jgi:hypothetical protein
MNDEVDDEKTVTEHTPNTKKVTLEPWSVSSEENLYSNLV